MDVCSPLELGRFFEVAPVRELRRLELVWHVPFGMLQYSRCKPWSWASHLLGHESEGSVAHALKQQGLVQVWLCLISPTVNGQKLCSFNDDVWDM